MLISQRPLPCKRLSKADQYYSLAGVLTPSGNHAWTQHTVAIRDALNAGCADAPVKSLGRRLGPT